MVEIEPDSTALSTGNAVRPAKTGMVTLGHMNKANPFPRLPPRSFKSLLKHSQSSAGWQAEFRGAELPASNAAGLKEDIARPG
jgi:hypothetical protein